MVDEEHHDDNLLSRAELLRMVDDEEPLEPGESPSARKVRPLLPEVLRIDSSCGDDGPRDQPLAPDAEYRTPNDSPSAKGMRKEADLLGEGQTQSIGHRTTRRQPRACGRRRICS